MEQDKNNRIELCQSCRSAPVEAIVGVDDPEDPYLICNSCRDRMISHSLRPREWYNLSAIHGHLNDLLDSEHYGEDGTALLPSVPVTAPDLLPCPALQDEKASPERLLTYILALSHLYEYEGCGYGWHIDISLINAVKRFPPEILLPVLRERLTAVRNREVIGKLFRIAGWALGSSGAALVREHWDGFAHTTAFAGIAFAAARCLPVDEAYQKISDELSKMSLRDRCFSKDVLRWLGSPHTLDWIEENACSPIDITWGPLAASSQFDWDRARKWLSSGRPLSLIALDALSWCMGGKIGALMNPPDAREYISTLKDYLSKDNVPRVRESISQLLGYAESL